MIDYITELLIDGTWQDITADVRDSSPIVMQRGRRDWATATDPSTMSLRLNNGPSKVSAGVQGRYSPRNPRSDLYGKIGRNTPIRVRADDGENAYLALRGVYTDYASTPDAAVLDVTGDLDLRIDVDPGSWRPAAQEAFARKYVTTGDQRSWALYMEPSGTVHFRWSDDGTASGLVLTESTVAAPEASERLALRVTLDVDNGAAGNDVKFWTSDTIDGTWTQLGATVTTAGTTAVFASTAAVEVGRTWDDVVGAGIDIDPFSGKMYAFEIRDGIDGTVVGAARFDEQEPEARAFTDDDSNTWTLNGDALIADDSIRFTGEAKSWPQEWDLSGADRWVPLTAAGLTRRLQQGSTPLKSSLYRDLTTQPAVVAYWPLEDLKGATRFNSGLAGDATFLTPSPASEVSAAADSDTFVASAPLPTVGDGSLSGAIPGYAGAATQRFTVLVAMPADVTWSSEKLLFRVLSTGGTVRRWDILVNTFGSVRLIAYNDTGAGVENVAAGLAMFGSPCALSLLVTQSGADTDWVLTKRPLTGADVTMSGNIPGETFGQFSSVELGSTDDAEGTTFGQAFVLNDDTDTAWDTFSDSFVAWAGETGLARLDRLSGDEGLPPVRAIGTDDNEAVGPQLIKTLMDLFREVPTATLGLLSDRPDMVGLQYRSRDDLLSQEPALVLDYASGMISAPFRPVEDDQSVANEITVTRTRGSSLTVAEETGPLSVLDPPDGVGKYDVSQEINIFEDSRLTDQAYWRLHLGTIDEPRFPEVTLNMRNPRVEALEDDVLSVREGDIIRITNPPIWLSGGPYDLFVEGFREEKSAVTHTLTFNCSPGSAWSVGVYDGDQGATESRYSSDGSTLLAGAGLRLIGSGYASTPDAAALDIVGDIDVRAHVVLEDWTPAGNSALVGKWTPSGNQRSYLLEVTTSGLLRFAWSNDGTATLQADSTVAPTVSDGDDLWVRATLDVDNGAAGRTVTFYTSTDGSSWAQLGSPVTTAGVTSIFASTAVLEVGSHSVGTADLLTGLVASAEVRSGIAGAVVADPDFDLEVAGTTSFVDDSGLTWTLTSPAVLGAAGSATETSITVSTPAGQLWGDTDQPFDILVGGERMRVTAVTGTVSPQTFTVVRSINGVVKAQTTDTEVGLFKPARYAL